MYLQGKVIANDIEADVLPEHAIVTEDGKTFIFVKKEMEENDHEEIGHDDHEGEEDGDHQEEEQGDHEEEGHGDHSQEGKIEFEMVEVITGATSNGYTEIKLLKPLPKEAQIAGSGAYYILAEMGKGETEHSH